MKSKITVRAYSSDKAAELAKAAMLEAVKPTAASRFSLRAELKKALGAPDTKALARQYLKVIEWSDEDNCYIGSAPPIIGQCCHGDTEAEVLEQLTTIVEEWVKIYLEDGRPLPEGTANKEYSGKFLVRVTPDVHKKAALKAAARGESLNEFVSEAIAQA